MIIEHESMAGATAELSDTFSQSLELLDAYTAELMHLRISVGQRIREVHHTRRVITVLQAVHVPELMNYLLDEAFLEDRRVSMPQP